MKHATSHSRLAACLASCLLALAACGNEDGASKESSAASLALDASEQAQTESSILWGGLSGVIAGLGELTLEQVAAEVVTNLETRYTPADCIQVDRLGASITATLDHCTGPFGLRTLTGDLQIEITSIVGNVIGASATATGLTSGGASFDFSAAASYTTAGADSSLAVSSEATGEGARGQAFTRTGDYAATWSETCNTLAGTWTLTTGENQRTTEINLERCDDACPTGTVSIAMPSGGTIEITFDGTAAVEWHLGTHHGSFSVVCSPA